MKISVQVKTNSKIESIEEVETNSFVIRTRTPPIEGKANERLVEVLAEHFNVPKSSVVLISGHKSKKKLFEIG